MAAGRPNALPLEGSSTVKMDEDMPMYIYIHTYIYT
jgi:hypothetical protein